MSHEEDRAVRQPRELRFSPWAVFHEDGDELLVMNLYPWQRPAKVLKDCHSLRQLLRSPAECSVQVEASALDEMTRLGVLLDSRDTAPPQTPHARESRAAPGRRSLQGIRVETEVAEDWGAQLMRLRELFRALDFEDGSHSKLAIVFRGSRGLLAQAGPLLEATQAALREEGLRPEAATYVLRVPVSAIKHDLGNLLDRWNNLSVVVEDELESTSKGPPAAGKVAIRELTKDGFAIRGVIPTAGNVSLIERVEEWQSLTENAGVIVELLARNTVRFSRIEPLMRAEQFEVAREQLASVAGMLGSSLLQSEPWRSILVHATLPGISRLGIDKEFSALFLSANGAWARSSAHADAMLQSSLSELLAASPANGRKDYRSSWDYESGWPRCWECQYAPLCDGYWTAEIEVLARTGHAERARLLAALECGVRMDTLQSLLMEMHAQAFAEANGPTLATYSRGTLQIQSGAQK